VQQVQDSHASRVVLVPYRRDADQTFRDSVPGYGDYNGPSKRTDEATYKYRVEGE
jgi:hypothetical protein